MVAAADPSLDAYWMPFTANRQFKANPRLLASADGMYYTTVDGRRVLDGTAGLWCVNAGHGREQITEAIALQAGRLDYAPSFQMGHPLPFELAQRLAEIAPEGMNKVFFTNSGSESVDSALKIAMAYHRSGGQATRTRFVGREKGYHGVGLRRHLGGRHDQQPPRVRPRDDSGCGSPAAHPGYRPQWLQPRFARARRGAGGCA